MRGICSQQGPVADVLNERESMNEGTTRMTEDRIARERLEAYEASKRERVFKETAAQKVDPLTFAGLAAPFFRSDRKSFRWAIK